MHIYLMAVSALKLYSGECPAASLVTSTQLSMPHGVVGPYCINESALGLGRRDDCLNLRFDVHHGDMPYWVCMPLPD